ncbi:hydroxyacylglutathione hydrolase [Sphingomonas cannabina]|uniref:hydroxyacylglutathione hydrolase n=1 Tax=Sphingomonas cannabina TaxID=2899123 RepID=UPI001F2BD32A|nr:hydroxyacylglutathione hydrolase [Sphingomonas cannabina]UIJ45072.1 hydroxyacylglutathione hydrolase [Sphingomonas cannabina]
MTDLEIVRVPAFDDNYIWLVHDPASNETLVVDPGDAAPALAAAKERGWTITQIWNTHWHPDHVGGNQAVKDATGALVTGPAAEAAKIPTLDRTVAEGDTMKLGAHVARVLDTPAHTAGHISYVFDQDGLLFPGDTIFAMGCGRLFEGTAADMYAAMRKYAALPPETRVFAAHEYTQSNGRYALVAEPDNEAIKARMVEVDRLRAAGEATLPTTIGEELATNPFLRASSPEELGERRGAKDVFRG